MIDKKLLNVIFIKMRVLKLLFVVVIFVFLLNSLNLCNAKPIKIFMVQSYSNKDLCGVPQLKGALDTLKKSGINDNNSQIKLFFMKTKLVNTTKALMDKVADRAYSEIEQFKPDIVFLFDDPAFSELAPKLIHKHIKVIFSGLNVKPEIYNKTLHFMDKDRHPTANITGVYEKLYIESSIKFIEHIVNKKGKIAILSSQDKVGRIVTQQIISELRGTPYENSIKIFWTDTLNDIKNAILEGINSNKSIIAYVVNTHSVLSKNGRMDIFHLIPIETSLAKKPDIAINKAFCKRGLFGGVVLDFYAMGVQAAKMALKVINGIPISQIPIEDAQKRERVINLNRAKELKIKIPLEVLDTIDEVY